MSRVIITYAFVTSHFVLQDLVPGTGFPPKPQDKNSALIQDFSGPATTKKSAPIFAPFRDLTYEFNSKTRYCETKQCNANAILLCP